MVAGGGLLQLLPISKVARLLLHLSCRPSSNGVPAHAIQQLQTDITGATKAMGVQHAMK